MIILMYLKCATHYKMREHSLGEIKPLSKPIFIILKTSFNIFLLDLNFDKSTIGLHLLLISYTLTKFPDDQRSIDISSIICLNCKFL